MRPIRTPGAKTAEPRYNWPSRETTATSSKCWCIAALQTGVLGLAAFTALMAALAWAFAATARRTGGLPLAIAGLALLAGYLTKNLTDDFFFRPSSLIFWAMAGMLLGLAARLPAKS